MDQKKIEKMFKGTIIWELMSIEPADIIAPDNPVEKQENVCGTMSELPQRVFGLLCKKEKVMKDFLSPYNLSKYLKARKQYLLVNDLIWTLIQMEIDIPKGSAFIREGFRIEWVEDEISDLLESIATRATILSGGHRPKFREEGLGTL